MERRTRRWSGLAIALALASVVLVAQGPLTPIGQLRGRTDAAGSLYTVAAAVSGAQGPLTPIAQLRGRTDSNGSLFTTVAGGTVTPDKVCLDATNQDACLQRNGAGILQLGNAATSTDFNRLQFGGATAAFPSLKRTTTSLIVRLADDSNDADLTARSISYSLRIIGPSSSLIRAEAPTVTSAGTSPSVTANNGTATFRVNVGTGGTATTIVLGLAATTTGWNCTGTNITAAAANRNPTGVLLQQSSTTTAATLQYQTVATGVALAFTASDIVQISCLGF